MPTTSPPPALSRFLLTGRSAVVTGGGSGIGRASALLLAAAGASVAIFDRNAEGANAVRSEIEGSGGSASAWGVDVSDEAALTEAFAGAARQHGRLDVLVDNAGIAIRGAAAELSLADWNKVVAVNLTGMFLAARIAASHIERQGGGAIVNTASIMGLSGGLYPNVAYQTTKGGVVNMTRALALEWAGLGIRVNAVAPTFVATQLTAGLIGNPEVLATIKAATPMGRLAEADEIASATLFLASPAAAMITGVILPVDGGFLAR
jgi:NAD(P)-dependent dehydrogenase (short-subunit alcohol dehydrogenase family)